VAVVCEDYPDSHISKENFTAIQRAIGRLVDELPEEGLTPRLVTSYWAKGAAIMVCKTKEPKTGWLPRYLPS
jgi:hypothetical protein